MCYNKSMTIIKIFSSKSKPGNKKPGWKKVQQDYEIWLEKTKSQTLFNPASKPKIQRTDKKIDPIVRPKTLQEHQKIQGVLPGSLNSFGGSGTKSVLRPEIQYRDNPEMLERELKARERKFCIAPAYNKGAEMLVTEESMKDIKSGANRRRS